MMVLLVLIGIPLLAYFFIRTLMAKFQDLSDALDDLAAEVVVITEEIAALKAAGAPLVTQDQLDALVAKTQAIQAALVAAE